MRLGIFGGTFDPVHFGHLLLAETAREEARLDEVWFIPASSSPHKQFTDSSSPQHRLEMLRLATAGHASFRVSDLEIARGGPSFTVATLQHLAAEHPDHELFLLMGADSLNEFHTWREPDEILKLATVVAVNRGRELPSFDSAIDSLGSQAREKILLVSMPAVGLSASSLRSRVQEGKSIRYQTPRAVELYVQQHQLYRA